jgi:uncharacterized Fe-S radical SAM superfamily protein PflX
VDNNPVRRSRKPIPAAQHGSGSTPRQLVSKVLKRTISDIDVETLQTLVKHYAKKHQGFTDYLEKELLVRGKDVEKYHVDSDSEDNTNSKVESEEDEDEDEDENDSTGFKLIMVGDDALTARYAKCTNCEEQCDVTMNERGYCKLHCGK